MKRTISTNQLTPGTIFMVKGNLSFSRLISRIDGEELARDIERRKANKGIPIETPYTTATITNATVVYKDPQNPTNEERYAEESIYAGKADGRMFTGVNKGTVLPSIAMMKGRMMPGRNSFREYPLFPSSASGNDSFPDSQSFCL